MTTEQLLLIRWVAPVALIVAGLLFGLIFEKIVLRKLKRLSARTAWQGDEIIISAVRGMMILWFTIAGVYAALETETVAPRWAALSRKLLLVTLIFSVTVAGSRVAAGFVKLYSKKTEGILPSTSIFTNLTKVIVFSVGVLVILQSLNISVTPVLTALGVGGLAVALALQDTLSNLFAGFQVILSNQVRPGDYVKLGAGEEGKVVDITWRNTSIRTAQNHLIVVPNSKLASSIVTNYSLPEEELALVVSVGVSYDSDLEKVEKVTLEVAKETMRQVPGGVPEFEPLLRYQALAESSISFHVVLRAREFSDQALLRHEFIKRLHQRYKQEAIEIPFPTRRIYVKEKDAADATRTS